MCRRRAVRLAAVSPTDDGPGERATVAAIPDLLDDYSRIALDIDHHPLAYAVRRFWGAMCSLRAVAATADSNIPPMLGFAIEENLAVDWLARAEEVDAGVARVAQAFRTADAGPAPAGPGVRYSVAAAMLDDALAGLVAAATVVPGVPPGLQVVGDKLRGPDGQLYDVFVPQMVSGTPLDAMVGPGAGMACAAGLQGLLYNADHGITPDLPTSMPQTDNGRDPGWVTVGSGFAGLTTIRPPTAAERAAATVSPDFRLYGTDPAAPADYTDLLRQLGARAPGPLVSAPGDLPEDDPFMDDADGGESPGAPGVVLPDTSGAEGAQTTLDAAGLIITAMNNTFYLDDASTFGYQTTFERNVDGRTRAVVRFYQMRTPDGADERVTSVAYGSLAPNGAWGFTWLTMNPTQPPGLNPP